MATRQDIDLARPRRWTVRTLLRVLVLVMALAAVAFCVKAIVDGWSSVRPSLAQLHVGWAGCALALAFAGMLCLALMWWRALHAFGVDARPHRALAWYFGGELGKYLPGGVWQVLGRGELAQRDGNVPRSTAYSTTLIGYLIMSTAAAVDCGILAPFLALDHRGGLGWAWALVALVPIGVVIVHPRALGRILGFAARLTKGRVELTAPSWPRMMSLIAVALPTWLLVGASSCAVAAAFGFDQHPARVAFAAIVAWIVGFLAVPVPAGAGIRELVFGALAGMVSWQAFAVAVGARLILILVDAVTGVTSLAYLHQSLRGRRPAPAQAAVVSAGSR